MNINMTNTTRCKWVAWGFCKVKRIHGWNNTATQLYIQLHETPPLTASGLVPANQVPNIKSFVATANNGFDYEFDGISCSELTLALSTSETKFVDPGANNGLDWTVEVDTMFDVRSGDLIAGDLTTGVNSLQVWSNASNTPQRLLRVDYLNGEGANQYLMIFTTDAPANGAKPDVQCPVNSNFTTSNSYPFGDAGFVPLGGQSTATKENVNNGCNLFVSSTSGTLTQLSDNLAALRAIYGAVSR